LMFSSKHHPDFGSLWWLPGAMQQTGADLIAHSGSAILEACSRVGSRPLAHGSKTLSGISLTDCIARALLCTISSHAANGGGNSFFDSRSVPAIPLTDYLRWLHQNLGCSDAVFVCASAILDRALGRSASAADEAIRLTVWNVHRLFFACLVLAAKYNEDYIWCNSDYARCGGISLAHLNQYEQFLLRKLGFRLNVDEEEYNVYLGSLTALAELSATVSNCPRARIASTACCAKAAWLHAWNAATLGVGLCLSGAALLGMAVIFSDGVPLRLTRTSALRA